MEKYFSASGNHSRFFCWKNASFGVKETDFLASTNHKLFFRLVEIYFLTNPSVQLLEKDFLFSANRLLHLGVLFY